MIGVMGPVDQATAQAYDLQFGVHVLGEDLSPLRNPHFHFGSRPVLPHQTSPSNAHRHRQKQP